MEGGGGGSMGCDMAQRDESISLITSKAHFVLRNPSNYFIFLIKVYAHSKERETLRILRKLTISENKMRIK